MAAAAQGVAIKAPSPRLSGRSEGLCRALARLLAPLWSEPLMVELVTAHGLELSVRRGREVWVTLQAELKGLVAVLEAHATQWGLLPAGLPPRKSALALPPPQPAAAGGGAAGGFLGGGGGFAGNGFAAEADAVATEAERRRLESEAIGQLAALASRTAQAAALLGALASDAASAASAARARANGAPPLFQPPTAQGGAIGRLTALAADGTSKLAKPLRAALKGLSLSQLVAPLSHDSQGRPLPGKWDAVVELQLPSAIFKELGSPLTAHLLRECPAFFSSSDEAERVGWAKLKKAADEATPEAERSRLLTEATAVFLPVAAHLDVGKILDTLLKARETAAATAGTAALATVQAAGRAMVDLSLGAARAVDPKGAATRVLLPRPAPGGPAAIEIAAKAKAARVFGGVEQSSEWPAPLKAALVSRLRCYKQLLEKLVAISKPAPPPVAAAGAPAAAPGTEPAWLALLKMALAVEPVDELFHHAAYWWMLGSGRDAELLKLPPATLEGFVNPAVYPLAEPAREVWARWLHAPATAEALGSFTALMGCSPASAWTDAEKLVATGALAPRLYFERQRFGEAAHAYARLAERETDLTPPPPRAPPIITPEAAEAAAAKAFAEGEAAAAGLPSPAAAESSPDVATLATRQRSLESRLAALSMALASASAAGGPMSAALTADFVRVLGENHHRTQLQVRVAAELAALLGSPARLGALVEPPTTTPSPTAIAGVRSRLDTLHFEVCATLVPRRPLLMRRPVLN